ncbi:MAG TPA: MBL fold metallo-hydrolase [Aggregatilineaceae bacterium]|nr:MBL fold metallo-hydrolase [Aggregatilineaceae bacterium]
MQEVSSGVFIATEFRRVTVGAILTDEGFVLIDTPPYPDDALRWRERLFQLSDKPILAIVNTDCHRDRVLGNYWFDAKVVIAQDDTIAQMRNLPSAFLDSAIESLIADTGERGNFAGVQLQVPSVGFSRRMQIRYGGRSIPLLAMPGPTTGNLWVHLPEERIVFVGDSVLTDQTPYISSPCTKNWLDNLTVLRRDRFPADTLVPGRGVITDKSATDLISNYLRVARRRVLSVYRAGRPRADTATIVPELLELFPYEEEDMERIQRRIKAGLDRIYEEYKLNDHGLPK